MAQKDTELSNNQKYKKVIQKKIMEYARRNKKELCRRKNILDYVANDPEVQKARKLRKYKHNDDAYPFEVPEDEKETNKAGENKKSDVDKSYYEDMFDAMLEDLVKKKKILKVKKPGTERVFYYTYGAPKPSVLSIEDKEVAVFKVESGNVKVAADIVKGNLKKDENIEIIVAGKYLLCEIKDIKKCKQEETQLPYIRERVRKALELAECTVEIKK